MNLNVERVIVKYNGIVVGYLQMLENDLIGFQYDEDWVQKGFSISPFSLPLSDKIFISKSLYFKGLYGVFNDSLPDGWGELLVRRMLSEKGINFDKISPLARLTIIAEDGLGGLDYEPIQRKIDNKENVDLDLIANDAKKLLENQNKINLDELYNFGGASGGARPKVHLNIDNEDWIIKFGALNDDLNIGLKEYEANLLARNSGINVNDFKLFESNKTKGYFGVKRFDRKNGRKVHVISLSALLETTHQIPNLDYMHLFQVIEKISVDKSNLYEAFKRMVFNCLYGNKDDHGKNFSFLYDEELSGYILSPAYDITKTDYKKEHEMTVLGNANPTIDDLMELARMVKLSKERCQEIILNIKNNIGI